MKSNITYNRFMTSGLALFRQFGFRKVSVEEICKKSGFSKMTFYKYFSNKVELMKSIIDHEVENTFQVFDRILESDIPFNEKIEQLIRLKLDSCRTYGPVLIMDILNNIKELHDYVFYLREEAISVSVNMYKVGVKEGFIRENITEQYFIFILNYSTQMVDDPDFTGLFPDVNDRIREAVELFFYGIYNYKTTGAEK